MAYATTHYPYAFGYASKEDAEAALEDMFATGEVNAAERPTIESYTLATFNDTITNRRKPRPIYWCIKLEDN